jgi:hypothetical protein
MEVDTLGELTVKVTHHLDLTTIDRCTRVFVFSTMYFIKSIKSVFGYFCESMIFPRTRSTTLSSHVIVWFDSEVAVFFTGDDYFLSCIDIFCLIVIKSITVNFDRFF